MHEMVKNGPGRIKVNQTKSDQIKPTNQIKPAWRGRTSISVGRVGCGEMLNG
jgi:hypothetical protein